MTDLAIFVPLTKADAAQRLVYGYFDETPDRAKEVFDYATSKPNFEKWSEGMYKASGGKSYGNIRAQHDPKRAAGLLKSIFFNDDEKRVEFCAHIVDDAEWAKVEAGVYTGFSPGGRYAKRWRDGDVTRYTADVGELSIVDVPCNPRAGFTMVKADGSEEEVGFVIAKAYEPGNDATKARALEMAKADNPEADETELKNLQKNYVGKARSDLIAEKADEELAELAKADAVAGADEDDHAGEGTHEPAIEKADPAAALDAALEKAEKKAKGKYGDVEYADAKNKKYPVDTAKHIRAAWSYINMPKNQKGYSADEVKAIKAKIVSAWKDKIDPDGPPEAAEKMFALGDLAKLAPAVAAIEAAADKQLPLRKGMYAVQRLASLIDCAADLQCCIKYEEQAEGDADSGLPEEAANAVATLGALLVHMVTEEVQEIVDQYRISGMDIDFDPEDDDDVLEMAAKIVDLAKAENVELEKAGKRNSSADAAKIQSIHDAACELGADCQDMSADKVAGLEAENERLTKSIDGALPRIEALAETVETQSAAMAKLTEEIEKLKAEPVMTKGKVISIDKEEDNGTLRKDADPEPGSLDAIRAMPDGPDKRHALNRYSEAKRFSNPTPA
jgi:hypothetical protein